MNGVIISIERDELANMISEAVEKGLSKKEPKKYLSRQEVSLMLGVSLPTIHNWINDGLLMAEKIGGRTLFDSEMVQAAVKEKSVFRYRHNRRG